MMEKLLIISCLVAIGQSLPFPQQLTEEEFNKRGRSLGLPDDIQVFISPSYSQVRRQGGRSFSDPIKFPTLTVKDPNQLADVRQKQPSSSTNGPIYNDNFEDIDGIQAKIELANQLEQERVEARLAEEAEALAEAEASENDALEAMHEESEKIGAMLIEEAAENLAALDMIQKMAGLDGEAGEAIDNIIVDTLAEEIAQTALNEAGGDLSDHVDLKTVDIGSIMEVQHSPEVPALTVEEAGVTDADLITDLAAMQILENAIASGQEAELAAQMKPLLEEAVTELQEAADIVLEEAEADDEVYDYQEDDFEDNLNVFDAEEDEEEFATELPEELNEIVDFSDSDETTVSPADLLDESAYFDDESSSFDGSESVPSLEIEEVSVTNDIADEIDSSTPDSQDDFGLIQEVTTVAA